MANFYTSAITLIKDNRDSPLDLTMMFSVDTLEEAVDIVKEDASKQIDVTGVKSGTDDQGVEMVTIEGKDEIGDVLVCLHECKNDVLWRGMKARNPLGGENASMA